MNLIDAVSARVKLKKAGAAEYAGPCPACQGNDRFRVWPSGGSRGTGTYWCRRCGRRGDVIQFYLDFDGMTFAQAAAAAGVDIGGSGPAFPARRVFDPPADTTDAPAPEFRHPGLPPDVWMEKAGAFVDAAAAALPGNHSAVDWLAGRGIPADAAKQYRLGWFAGENGKNAAWRPRESWGLDPVINDHTGKPKRLWIPRGIVIPHIIDGRVVAIKIRRPRTDTDAARPDSVAAKKYYMLPGSYAGFMVCGDADQAAVIVEAELDAICCAHACNGFASAVAVKTSTARPDARAAGFLSGCLRLLVALDCDAAGRSAAARWLDDYPAVRWPVTRGKDPGEAVAAGVDLRAWVWAGLPPVLTIGRSFDGVKGREGAVMADKKAALEQRVEELMAWIDNPANGTVVARRAKVPEVMDLVRQINAIEDREAGR